MSIEPSQFVGPSLFVVTAGMLLSYRVALLRNSNKVTQTLNSVGKKSASTAQAPSKSPASKANDCETCDCDVKPNDMIGSVKNYDRHVVICVPPGADKEWLNDIALQAETFPYSLNRSIETLVKAAKKSNKAAALAAETSNNEPTAAAVEPKIGLNVKVTAMVLNPEDPLTIGSAQILVYPDNLAFDLIPDQVSSFAELVMQPKPLQECSEVVHFQHSAPWFGLKKLILVCIHNARDKRCGAKGPELIAQLEAHLQHPEITYSDESTATTVITGADVAYVSTPTKQSANAPIVRGSSHIGGHVYAGTLIVYPEGRWYGRVSKNNVPELLKCIQDNTVYNECLRGCTSSDVLQW